MQSSIFSSKSISKLHNLCDSFEASTHYFSLYMVIFLICGISSLDLPNGTQYFHSFHQDYLDWETSKYANGSWIVADILKPNKMQFQSLLQMNSVDSYYAISTAFDFPIYITSKPFLIQYEVLMLKKTKCTGSYIKLFDSPSFLPSNFSNSSPYYLLFGPDVCGSDRRIRFIIVIDEQKYELNKILPPKVDSQIHLYGLAIYPNNTFHIYVDNRIVFCGDLLTDFDPPFDRAVIPDPDVIKPETWVDNQFISEFDPLTPNNTAPIMIPDPSAKELPLGWDESLSEYVPEPNVTPPPTWDAEVLGPWEPPLVFNPRCVGRSGCGKYTPRYVKNGQYSQRTRSLVQNPRYQGDWNQPMIENPHVVDAPGALPPLTGIGIEVYSVDPGCGFANILIADNVTAVIDWNKNNQYVDAQPSSYPTMNVPPPDKWAYVLEMIEEMFDHEATIIVGTLISLSFSMLIRVCPQYDEPAAAAQEPLNDDQIAQKELDKIDAKNEQMARILADLLEHNAELFVRKPTPSHDESQHDTQNVSEEEGGQIETEEEDHVSDNDDQDSLTAHISNDLSPDDSLNEPFATDAQFSRFADDTSTLCASNDFHLDDVDSDAINE